MAKVHTFLFTTFILLLAGSTDTIAQLDGSGNAPDFTLTDIDSVDHHLYEYLDSNKVVLIDFFTVWCGICRSNTYVLENIYKKYGPGGSDKLVLLSLEADSTTTDKQVADFADYYNADYPHINTTLDTGTDYQVPGFPAYYVIAPDRSYRYFPGIEMFLEDSLSGAIENSPGLREVENDARITRFITPKGTYCNEDIIPEIEIQNYGKNQITEIIVDLEIDEVLEYSQYFIDTINPYGYVTWNLPGLQNIKPGWHSFEFSITSVNTKADAEDNNGPAGGFFLFLEESEEIEVHVKTDAYPAETYWQIAEDGKIASERLSFDRARTIYSDQVCLEAGKCYTLLFYDRFGDGLSEGWVSVLYKGDTLASLSSDSINGRSSEIDFCINTGSLGTGKGIQDLFYVDVFPNPASREINLVSTDNSTLPARISIYNLYGEVLYEEYNVDLSIKKTIDLTAFPNGILFLRIFKANNTTTKKILIHK